MPSRGFARWASRHEMADEIGRRAELRVYVISDTCGACGRGTNGEDVDTDVENGSIPRSCRRRPAHPSRLSGGFVNREGEVTVHPGGARTGTEKSTSATAATSLPWHARRSPPASFETRWAPTVHGYNTHGGAGRDADEACDDEKQSFRGQASSAWSRAMEFDDGAGLTRAGCRW